MRRYRLAVFTSHPIQYQAPLFRALAAYPSLELEVFFGSRHGVDESYDREFATAFRWDVPLLEGYRHTFLENRARRPNVSAFSGVHVPGIRQRCEPVRFGVGRIGLEGDLDWTGWREQGASAPDHRRHRLGRHQRRRAAAKEDRRQPARAGQRRLRLHVGEDRRDQRRLHLALPAVAHDVEIAIGTDAGAVGPVDVEGDVRPGFGNRISQSGPP